MLGLISNTSGSYNNKGHDQYTHIPHKKYLELGVEALRPLHHVGHAMYKTIYFCSVGAAHLFNSMWSPSLGFKRSNYIQMTSNQNLVMYLHLGDTYIMSSLECVLGVQNTIPPLTKAAALIMQNSHIKKKKNSILQ